MARERGLAWSLVLGTILLIAGACRLVIGWLTGGMNTYDWVTGCGTLSLGAFFVLMFLERAQADRPEWHRFLAACRWGSFGLFLVFVGIATFIGLSDTLG